MAEFENGADTRSIMTPSFRLVFSWTGDRWAHELRCGGDAGWYRLAGSVEASPKHGDRASAPSPAYQQIDLQHGRSGPQALLVGQSGPHHYSAVFTVREHDASVQVEVDVADRCRSASEDLACPYRVEATPGDLGEAGDARIVWSLGASRLGRLALVSAGPLASPTRLILAEAGRSACQVQVLAQVRAATPTNRCIYQWCWQPGLVAGRLDRRAGH
jgi:hypothetical protein